MLLQVRKPADAVGHADAAQPVDPRIGVGGEAGVVFAGHADQLDRALFDHLVELQDVIAGNAEDVLDPQGPEPVDQVLADRHGRSVAPAHGKIAALARYVASRRTSGRDR